MTIIIHHQFVQDITMIVPVEQADEIISDLAEDLDPSYTIELI